MAGTFDQRTAELAERVGDGDLTGKLTVNQRYAAIQHEDLTLRHDPGRIPKYVEKPLHDNADDYARRLAGEVLEGDLAEAMAGNMEHLSSRVEALAPIDYDDLPRSGHPTVTDQGDTVYDREPQVPRLSEQQLRAKSRGEPYR